LTKFTSNDESIYWRLSWLCPECARLFDAGEGDVLKMFIFTISLLFLLLIYSPRTIINLSLDRNIL